MFDFLKKKEVFETRWISVDFDGVRDLWTRCPTLLPSVYGDRDFFYEDPDFQVCLNKSVNQQIVNMFQLPVKSCMEILVVVNKKGTSVIKKAIQQY